MSRSAGHIFGRKSTHQEKSCGQLLRFECNECGLQTESPSLLQKHQIRAHIADTVKTAEPSSVGSAIPTATDGKAMTGPTERFKKHSPHEGPVAKPNTSSNASVDCHEEATATMQKIGKLNFPPLNPENQSRGTLDDHAKPIAASVQRTPKEAPGCIRPEAALLAAAPVI